MNFLFLAAASLQALFIAIDEIYFHRKRDLPRWERLGHPIDAWCFALPLGILAYAPMTPGYVQVYIGLSVLSCLCITKDEWVHRELATAFEAWLHSVLFILHPVVLISGYFLWAEQPWYLVSLFWLVLVFGLTQFIYWNLMRTKSSAPINNAFYSDLSDCWYTAHDDPVALLRAESRLRNAWIIDRIGELFPKSEPKNLKVLDVGCGAGFLSNALGQESYQVSGVDLSTTSLEVARRFDASKSVDYREADAYQLPYPDKHFSVVTSMDFLEHVSEPKKVLAEITRVLEPDGVFFFHTFNRNKLAEFIVIRSLEIFVKNTPAHMHVIELFIKPAELKTWLQDIGYDILEMRGVRPVIFQMAILKLIFTGIVDPKFRFTWSKSLAISYTGVARLKK